MLQSGPAGFTRTEFSCFCTGTGFRIEQAFQKCSKIDMDLY